MRLTDSDIARFIEDWAIEQVLADRIHEVPEPWDEASDDPPPPPPS